jgi:hypothetical protein
MNETCKHIGKDGYRCGSYAFNLYKDDIDQSDLCDVHYWQTKAQRTWVGLTEEEIGDEYVRFEVSKGGFNRFEYAVRAIEAKLKEKNT